MASPRKFELSDEVESEEVIREVKVSELDEIDVNECDCCGEGGEYCFN